MNTSTRRTQAQILGSEVGELLERYDHMARLYDDEEREAREAHAHGPHGEESCCPELEEAIKAANRNKLTGWALILEFDDPTNPKSPTTSVIDPPMQPAAHTEGIIRRVERDGLG